VGELFHDPDFCTKAGGRGKCDDLSGWGFGPSLVLSVAPRPRATLPWFECQQLVCPLNALRQRVQKRKSESRRTVEGD